MTVPKTAMYEEYGPPSWKDEIWGSWQGFYMQSKAQAASMKTTPDDHFWLGISCTYSCHHTTADFRRYNVSQLGQAPVEQKAMPQVRSGLT